MALQCDLGYKTSARLQGSESKGRGPAPLGSPTCPQQGPETRTERWASPSRLSDGQGCTHSPLARPVGLLTAFMGQCQQDSVEPMMPFLTLHGMQSALHGVNPSCHHFLAMWLSGSLPLLCLSFLINNKEIRTVP